MNPPTPVAAVHVRRFPTNPIIRPRMDARMGDNINGPSLVRAPDWVARPLGRYYLYFGHHRGTYIRLAYADDLAGPWRTYEPGVLDLTGSYFVKHIASPDVLVDGSRREVRLYYHGPLAEGDRHGPHGRHGQATRVAISTDGLHFTARAEVLGAPYMRLFRWGDWYYGIAMPGIVYRSRDGLAGFEEGHNPFAAIATDMRHAAVLRDGDLLYVFYTNRGDCPERILLTTLDLTKEWTAWRATEPVPVLEPELPYEGADRPLVPSRGGPILEPARQLRDPYVFQEDGRTYLLYAVAGEQGIAIAEIAIIRK
jgi:hypothetical protein